MNLEQRRFSVVSIRADGGRSSGRFTTKPSHSLVPTNISASSGERPETSEQSPRRSCPERLHYLCGETSAGHMTHEGESVGDEPEWEANGSSSCSSRVFEE